MTKGSSARSHAALGRVRLRSVRCAQDDEGHVAAGEGRKGFKPRPMLDIRFATTSSLSEAKDLNLSAAGDKTQRTGYLLTATPMKRYELTAFGFDNLKLVDRPRPEPGHG